MDIYTQIIRLETEGLPDNEYLDLFSALVKTGLAWQLQGFYGRSAQALINGGYLDRDGNILILAGGDNDD